MSYGNLIGYITMRTHGAPDMVMRTYDLSYLNTRRRQWRALKLLGISCTEFSAAIDYCVAGLRAHDLYISATELAPILGEWFTWRRITNGELRAWKYLPGKRGKQVRSSEIPKRRFKSS